MNSLISKLSSKAQTVIPKRVRQRLGLKSGDYLRYIFLNDQVVIERVKNKAEDDPFSTFTEWGSEADEIVYKSL